MPAQTINLTPPPAHVPERDSTDRSIAIGILCTVLFHLLVVVFSPRFAFNEFSGSHSGISVRSTDRGKTFDFELAPGATQEKEKDPFRFVETNSAAPENIPDKTNNFSNRNQQSAQEVAALEKDPENRPSVKGQDEIKSDTIVSGDMAPPQLAVAPTPEVAQQDALDRAEQKARAEQVPLDGFEKTEGLSEDGIATNISKSKSPTTRADQALEGAPNATDPTGGLVAVTASSQAQQPKQRPRLSSTSLNRSSPLTNRTTGVTNIGVRGIDARWSEYGEYLNRVVETVQAQWFTIINESHIAPASGSSVSITFRINSNGETDIIKVEDAAAGKQGVFSCQSAITDRSPYGKWSDAMIAVLGESQELTFSFYY